VRTATWLPFFWQKRQQKGGKKMGNGKLFKFYVPYVDSHGQEISHEKRDDFINVIETESAELNGGFTKFEAEGGYKNREGELIRERNTIIETYGENPLSSERMVGCLEYLAQESLVVMVTSSSEFIDYKKDGDITMYRHPAEPSQKKKTDEDTGE
jgi:hypothetical protein